MNKIITLALAVAMFVGCKKSENDPGLSFRSRDKKNGRRVVGCFL
jgi:hypothetical protein